MKCSLSSRCEREHQRCGDRALFGTTDCEGCVGPVADLDGCEHELASVKIGDINRPAVAYPIARNDVASFADEVELVPRLELRPRRRVALDLLEGVEGAPLDPGARPGLAHGLGAPAPAVGDDHALEFSDLAMYQETTLSPLQHMSTTSSRATRIPST